MRYWYSFDVSIFFYPAPRRARLGESAIGSPAADINRAIRRKGNRTSLFFLRRAGRGARRGLFTFFDHSIDFSCFIS
jgi:hypothetical protein